MGNEGENQRKLLAQCLYLSTVWRPFCNSIPLLNPTAYGWPHTCQKNAVICMAGLEQMASPEIEAKMDFPIQLLLVSLEFHSDVVHCGWAFLLVFSPPSLPLFIFHCLFSTLSQLSPESGPKVTISKFKIALRRLYSEEQHTVSH